MGAVKVRVKLSPSFSTGVLKSTSGILGTWFCSRGVVIPAFTTCMRAPGRVITRL